MSRSRKRTPVSGNTIARSDKIFKTIEHRKERAAVRTAMRAEEELPGVKQFGDPWDSQKDGKHYFKSADPKILRK